MKWHTMEVQGYNLYLDTLPIGLYFRTSPLQIPFSKSSPENPSLLFFGGTSKLRLANFRPKKGWNPAFSLRVVLLQLQALMMLGISLGLEGFAGEFFGVDVSRVHTLIPRVDSNGGFRYFCIFNSYLGKMNHVFGLAHIFQLGGNHQLVGYGFSDLNAHLNR